MLGVHIKTLGRLKLSVSMVLVLARRVIRRKIGKQLLLSVIVIVWGNIAGDSHGRYRKENGENRKTTVLACNIQILRNPF